MTGNIVCKDLTCITHGRTLRRFRRLQRAVAQERREKAELRKQLEASLRAHTEAERP